MEELKLSELELPKFVLYLRSKFDGELQEFFNTKERMKRLLELAKKTFKHDHGIYTVSDSVIQEFHHKALQIVIDDSLWEMSKTGEAEVLIGEGGDFYYKLTDKGKQAAERLLELHTEIPQVKGKGKTKNKKIEKLQIEKEILKKNLKGVDEKIQSLKVEIERVQNEIKKRKSNE